MFILLATVTGVLAGCGGSSSGSDTGGSGGSGTGSPNPGTAAGTYTVTITATSGATVKTSTVTLALNESDGNGALRWRGTAAGAELRVLGEVSLIECDQFRPRSFGARLVVDDALRLAKTITYIAVGEDVGRMRRIVFDFLAELAYEHTQILPLVSVFRTPNCG